MAMVGLMASATEVTENFTTADTWWGISDKNHCVATVKTATSPATGIEYTYTYTYASNNNGVIIQGTTNTKTDVGGYMTFKASQAVASITLKTGTNASTAAVVDVYAGETLIKKGLALDAKNANFVINVPEANQAAGTVYKVYNAAKSNAQFQSMTLSSEAGEEPEPVEKGKYQLTTTMATGKYVMVVDMEGALKLCTPPAASATYGRLNLTDISLVDGYVESEDANALTLTVADGKVTIMDANNRYYGMDVEHLTSFQFYTEVNEGCYWTYKFEGDNVKLTNNLTGCIATTTKGAQGTWYTNLAPAKDPEDYLLPILYKYVGTSAIEAVEAAATDAPAVYYNLQGQRVANPANGLFIRVAGNKATKVVL